MKTSIVVTPPIYFSICTDIEGELNGASGSFFNLVKSRLVATCMLLIACLQPIEVFAMQCQNTGLTCTDSTPCKSVNGVLVCLSTVPAAQLPAGALQSSQPCWTAAGTYACLNPTSVMNDTCTPLNADPKCGKINATCITNDPATGVCTAYSDTYQCQTGGGATVTGADCSGQTYCTNGTCFTKKDKPNNALAKVVTAVELTRQAGFYMDPATLTAFGGQSSWCTQNNMGLANCCKPDPKGKSYTNAILVNELIKNGWNAWVREVVGSSYTFDTLFDSATGYAQKAVDGMSEVLGSKVTATGNSVTAAPANANAPGGAVGQPPGAGVGGVVGGMVGQQFGSALAANNGANTGFQGAAGALGYAGGTVLGTYAGAGAYSFAFGPAGSGFMSGVSGVSICIPCISAVLVFMIIMAFLACDIPEAKTQLKLGAGICHHVGSYCSAQALGGCVTTRQQYCCFNSKLAKIIQEQGRPQLGRGWGTAQTPDCSGITVAELGQLDFSKMDLSEFMADVTAKATPDATALAANAQAKVKAFYAATPNPTLTYGVVPPPAAGVPQPVVITATNPTPSMPAMPACNTAVAKNAMAANSDQSGTITVSSCLANGIASFVYTGDCATLQTNVVTDVTLDANGTGVFNTLVSGVCRTSNNLWTARIIDPVTGNMPGKINVTW